MATLSVRNLPDEIQAVLRQRAAQAGLSMNGALLEDIASRLAELPIIWLSFSSEQAAITAGLLPLTKQYGLSLGDRACIALAIEKNIPIYTADRVWGELPLPVPVVKIR